MEGATAIVLAGGRSSRMGRPKALLPFDGEPLILHILNALHLLFDDIVVVASPGQELPELPARIVRDAVAYQGPVGGICYGLSAATGDVAFVTSCDSAFLSHDLIAHLVAASADYDVVVPHWEGRLQPLQAVYRVSVLPLLQAQLARGELRPVFLFDKVRTLRVAEEEVRRLDPQGLSFFNMNTPEDYDAALRRWPDGRLPEQRAADDVVHCTVELFGVAHLVAKTKEVPLSLSSGATFASVLSALVARLPALSGRVITPDGSALIDGYACNVNGVQFVRSTATPVSAGDRLIILSADAGG